MGKKVKLSEKSLQERLKNSKSRKRSLVRAVENAPLPRDRQTSDSNQ